MVTFSLSFGSGLTGHILSSKQIETRSITTNKAVNIARGKECIVIAEAPVTILAHPSKAKKRYFDLITLLNIFIITPFPCVAYPCCSLFVYHVL